MKRLFLMLLCGVALLAQDTVSRIVKVKHINPESATMILNVLAGKQVHWQPDAQMKIIALNGPSDLVKALEEAIQKLDVPQPVVRNVELTFHMLLAAPQGDSAAVPPELAGVATQLRNVFGLKSLRVLETAVLRGREGNGGQMSGVMSMPAKVEANATFELRYSKMQVSSSEKGQNIRIDNLRFLAKVPHAAGNGFQFSDAAMNTDIDVREGQKVVVGKSSIDAAAQSLFLVVTAKVVD
jgi:hypothetical protein